MMYGFDSRVRYSEIGEDKKLTLYHLINYFQDCTTFHSASIGYGVDSLVEKGFAWVLSAWQIVICRYPEMGEAIRINTWPYEFKGFAGKRNFQMTTETGEVLAYANSIWTYINLQTGKPARVPKEQAEVYGLESKLDMEYLPRKIELLPNMEAREEFAVSRYHLDTNHHVNNAQYVRYAQEYLPSGFPIRQMRAEYRKQVMLGEHLIPYVGEKDGVVVVTLCDQENQPCAIVEVCS